MTMPIVAPEISPHVKAGSLRGVAVTTTSRSLMFPEIPTIAENASINAAVKMEDVRAKLQGAGIEIQGGTPEQFGSGIKAEVDKWGRIVKAAGIQAD